MFNPLIEVIVQFIPRFLFPQKDLYGHLEQIAYGIALSEHSVRSGTTVPFFGEYYAMFGWPGIFVGTLIFTVVALKIINLCGSLSVTYRQYLLSVSLISLYAGYYYYSRGSIAQIFKGGIFILLPYFLLLWLQRKSRFRF